MLVQQSKKVLYLNCRNAKQTPIVWLWMCGFPITPPGSEIPYKTEVRSHFTLFKKERKEVITRGTIGFGEYEREGVKYHIGNICLPKSKKFEFDLYVSWVKAKEIKCDEGVGGQKTCTETQAIPFCPSNFNILSLNKGVELFITSGSN